MALKLLLVLLCVGTVLGATRFKDEEMMKAHHNHHFNADANITVFLIPHSHDDVGWLKTVDNYYYGGDQATQWAGVQYTIDSVVTELSLNPSYKFSIVEMAFLYRWWNNANETQRDLIKKHVKNGQLEIINGGWCMNDEATTYYEDIIDQMTIGFTWVKDVLGAVPTIGWHLDPFGHQSSQAALFSQMGFNAWFFSRIDYQDKQVRLSKKAMEMVWHPTQYSGNDNSIFTHVNYYHYSPPPGFCFDSACRDTPIKDDPTLDDYNVVQRSTNLTNYFKSMATHFRSNNLMHTIGEDFHYSNARLWYLNFDKLFKYINSRPEFGVKLKYATPGEYIEAINAEKNSYPTKTDDFFPYADRPSGYWTGYFTSRVSIKSLVKELGRYLQTVRTHIGLLKINGESNYINNKDNTAKIESAIWEMEMASGILQHHDAVAGTEKQKVANDYVRIASKAYSVLNSVYDEIRKELIKKQIGELPQELVKTLWNSTFQEWGVSAALSAGKKVLLQLYNPGSNGTYPIRIKVDNSASFINIVDMAGKFIKGDLICSNSKNTKDCELIFNTPLKAAAYTYIKLAPLSSGGSVKVIPLETVGPTAIIKTFQLTDSAKVAFTRAQIKLAVTLKSGEYSIFPEYNYYESYQGDDQKSGAYIFRPSQDTLNKSKKYTTFKSYQYAEGDTTVVFVMEGDKTYTKMYFSKIPNEIEERGFEVETFIDSIDVSDGVGKEVVFAVSTSLSNNKTFYTDSNGLEELKRVVDFRPTWTLSVNQPVSGNYYPINSHITIAGKNGEKLSVVVDRSEGGTACKDGVIELMIHRRTLRDDARGVGEPLNQTDETGKGLTQKVRHWIVYGNNTRLRQKVNDQPIVVTWSNSNNSQFTSSTISDTPFPVPNDVKLYLRPYTDGTFLLRLHNFNTQESKSVTIPGDWKTTEMTLGANQKLSQWKSKQMKWKDEPYTVEDYHYGSHKRVTEARTSDGSGEISLKPFEMKTFILSK